MSDEALLRERAVPVVPTPAGLLQLRRDVYLAVVNGLLRLPGHRLRRTVFTALGHNVLGAASVLERGCRLTGRGGVRIGAGCNINRGVLLDGRGGLTMGDHVNVSAEVLLLTAQHDVHSRGFVATDAPVTLGDRCWVSTRAMVLPGCTVGAGTVVAAGAVVTGDLPADVVTAGVPARVLGDRAPDAQADLPRYQRWLH